VWDSVAQDSFDEVKISDMLQWSSEFLLGAKRSIAKEASTMVGEFAEIERIRSDLYRCFLKSRVRKHKLKQEIANSVTDVERCAAQFVHSSHEGWKDGNGIDQILDEETMSFDSACGAVLQSLRNEASFRQAKIDALLERKQGLAKNTPRRVKVVGLQGEAAAANGIYIADGLRASWGRPVYAQCSISGGDRECSDAALLCCCCLDCFVADTLARSKRDVLLILRPNSCNHGQQWSCEISLGGRMLGHRAVTQQLTMHRLFDGGGERRKNRSSIAANHRYGERPILDGL
jgi:hypothetical protein